VNNKLPVWISTPTHKHKQTETYRQWRILIRERMIQNRPAFLDHLSEAEIHQTLGALDQAMVVAGAQKLSPFVLQIRAYEHQFELIAWSYFSLMGDEFKVLKEKLSPDEFAHELSKIGVSLEEAQLAISVAEAHEND
jgi:hypothetical protein